MVYLNQKNKIQTSETGNCQNGNEASISTRMASVEQTTKKACSIKLRSQKKVKNERAICWKIQKKNNSSLILLQHLVVKNRHGS